MDPDAFSPLIKMQRPTGKPRPRFKIVICCSTRNPSDNTYQITLGDNGHWEIECPACGACMPIADLMELGNADLS